MTTELNPTTHALVNHDAARRQRELDFIMSQVNKQNPEDSEVPPTLAPAARTISVDDPPQVTAPPTVVEPTLDWQKEAETFKERHRNAERALTPALQKAASATKALEKTEGMFKEMQDKLDRMEALLTAPKAPVYRAEDDPEFATNNPEVAERLALLTQSFNERLAEQQKAFDDRVATLETTSKVSQKAIEEERHSLYIQHWDKELYRLVPDIDLFKPGATYGMPLVEWGATIAPEYARAIGDPYSHTPQFVAEVINAFKNQKGLTVNGKRPSLGDLANPSLMGSSRVVVEQPTPVNLLSDYEFQNIQSLVDAAFRDTKTHKTGYDLMARYESTLLAKQKR